MIVRSTFKALIYQRGGKEEGSILDRLSGLVGDFYSSQCDNETDVLFRFAYR